MDLHGRQAPRDRPAAARVGPARQAGAARPRARGCRPRPAGRGRRADPRRAPRPDVRLLSPGARARGAGTADAAAGGGLTVPEIARALLVPEATVAQRLVRAKRKCACRGSRSPSRRRRAPRTGWPPCWPSSTWCSTRATRRRGRRLPERARRRGDPPGRSPHCCARQPEATGLVALMLLLHAPPEARLDTRGDVVLLEEQDRSRWNRAYIAEGAAARRGSLRRAGLGPPLALQAAIAAGPLSSRARAEDHGLATDRVPCTMPSSGVAPLPGFFRSIAPSRSRWCMARVSRASAPARCARARPRDSTKATTCCMPHGPSSCCVGWDGRPTAAAAYERALALATQRAPSARFLARRRAECEP